jgi:hypothetical protein
VSGIPRRRIVGAHQLTRRNVAMVLDRKTEIFKERAEPRRTQGRRTHQRAALRRAYLDGHAEQRDAFAGLPAGQICQAGGLLRAGMDRSTGLWFNLFTAGYLE